MGSSSTATVVESIASTSAAASPKGTTRKPGANGPKPRRASSSVENETIVVVRPWKLPSATMIVARPAGVPLTSYPHLRAVLIAVSTASAPVFMGSIISVPVNAVSLSANVSSRSWSKAREVSVRRSNCACAAAVRAGWRCPKFSAEYPASRSR